MGETMERSDGFAWMWGTALACLILCAYFIWKKNPAQPNPWGNAEPERSVVTVNDETNQVYVAQATPVVVPVATDTPAKMV
ncbi:Aste57867_1041 [Aphanomyces stellatus]|uniref:Aste57867_1041 protein n=1 Tax=Aphanomyces stellatus TaxID=120398 RepID=A0A485K6U7_9STRA|nr:hypothetical protein As57867_001040 [Aphanomyces stellatus]VFT78263.1 Aste57867_1041 [Aphanomyces stellatus]